MAVTQEELAIRLIELDEAIDSGVLVIRDADGKTTTYRSMSEMLKARGRLADRILAFTDSARRRSMGISITVNRGV